MLGKQHDVSIYFLFQVARTLCGVILVLLYFTRIAEDKQMTKWKGIGLMD